MTAVAQVVRLARSIDRDSPCCENLAYVRPSHTGPHAAELRCENCGRHRGWLSKSALNFLNEMAGRFGAPLEPIILRDSSIGNGVDQMTTTKEAYENKPNRGVLFRNKDKDPAKENDRDYQGSVNVEGVDYWISGWIKESDKAGKYMTLSLKPKNEAATAKKPEQLKAPGGEMLIELRIGGGDKGAQTIFPGSVHECGEPIIWEENGEPTNVVDGNDLLGRVK
jgi:hypothetical protein